MSRLLATALVFAIAAILVTACGGGSGDSPSKGATEVRGLVVEVTPRSITELERLVVRDGKGTLWRFTSRGPVGLSPSHLRDHMLGGQAVTVHFRKEGEDLVALEVTD